MRDRDCTFDKTRSSRFGKNVNSPRGDSEALSIGTVLDVRAPDIQVESKGFRLGGFCDSLPQGGDLRCRKPIRSICVNVLPALSVRAGRGTLPRPISKCQFLSS